METVTYRKQQNGMTRVDMEEYFDDVEIDSLYQWIDRIPLTRPKKNITKDFSDAVRKLMDYSCQSKDLLTNQSFIQTEFGDLCRALLWIVLCAEVVKHYFPRLVELHNYTPAASTKQKLENWYLLNRRVLRRLDLDLSDDVLRALANSKPKVIEKVLMLLRLQIDRHLERSGRDFTWRRRELYFVDPLMLRLPLSDPNPDEAENTPQGTKSPRGQAIESSSRSMSPSRQTKSEPVTSPRKYNKGEIPHGHPDRTSYLADKPLPLIPRPFLPPVSDNVPRVLYDEKEMECQAKEETIQILNAKIRRLEHLLHLKDVRIDDLHASLQQTIGLGYSTRKR